MHGMNSNESQGCVKVYTDRKLQSPTVPIYFMTCVDEADPVEKLGHINPKAEAGGWTFPPQSLLLMSFHIFTPIFILFFLPKQKPSKENNL